MDDDEIYTLGLTPELALWRLFTEYNLRNSPLEPYSMSLSAFRTLCKDCSVLKSPTAAAEYQIAFTAEVKKIRIKVKQTNTLGFSSFCDALARLSYKRYPRLLQVEAFQNLLTEVILPRAILIKYDGLEDLLEAVYQSSIQSLRATLEPSLKELLTEYQTLSSKAGGKSLVSYEQFLRFSSDFDLVACGLLSNYEIGKSFVVSVGAPERNKPYADGLGLNEFWHVLVALSLRAYRQAVDVPMENKVKAILVHMWRVIQRTSADVMQKANHASSLSHVFAFKAKIVDIWKQDGYIDYLHPMTLVTTPARDLLRTIPSPVKSTLVVDGNLLDT